MPKNDRNQLLRIGNGLCVKHDEVDWEEKLIHPDDEIFYNPWKMAPKINVVFLKQKYQL